MRRLMAAVLTSSLAMLWACGGSPTGTEASGEIVDLVLDADSITFVQTGVDLTESLYGITSEGDTVYNPSGSSKVTPSGFQTVSPPDVSPYRDRSRSTPV